MRRALVWGYCVFSTVSTLYLLYKLEQYRSEHTLLRDYAWNHETRIQRQELLWGILPCQGNTLDSNP